MRLKPLSLSLTLLLGSLTLPAGAVVPFTIRDIRVEGLQRTDLGTVLTYLPLKIGDRFDDERSQHAIETLFKTGFFDDIRLKRDGNTLLVSVTEQPTIDSITIKGAKEIKKDEILKQFKSKNMVEGHIFNKALLDQLIVTLKELYYEKSYFSVSIKTTSAKLPHNRISVQIDISEGKPAKIKQINIIGNRLFKEKELLDLFSLTPSSFWTWLTQFLFHKTNLFSKQKFTDSLERLHTHYLNHGYLDFKIYSAQAAISDDKKSIYLTISLSEGPQYHTGTVTMTLADKAKRPTSALAGTLQIKESTLFSREKVHQSIENIKNRLGEKGFAFPQVTVELDLDREAHRANLTFYVDPGRRFSVRNITISGNTTTRDEVVRRQLQQMESAPYNLKKIQRSKERLRRLDSFENFNITTPLVPDATNAVDLNVNVVQKKVGRSVNLSIAYDQTEKLILFLNFKNNNYLGSGKQFSTDFSKSRSTTNYALSVLDPYATPDGISLGWNAYHRTNKKEHNRNTTGSPFSFGETDTVGGRYKTTSYGLGGQIGFPTSEVARLTLDLQFEHIKIHTGDNAAQYILDFIKKNGHQNNSYFTELIWTSETRDSISYPTRGRYTEVRAGFTLPFSSVNYYKLQANNKYYFPLHKHFSLLWHVHTGYAAPYGGNIYPFYKNFYAGGMHSIRGFEGGTIGPKYENHGIGGTRIALNTFELLFPVPGRSDDPSTRLGLFFDAGSVWGENDPLRLSDLRASLGIAFYWNSPLGNLQFSYGVPIKKRNNDQLSRFQFGIGVWDFKF